MSDPVEIDNAERLLLLLDGVNPAIRQGAAPNSNAVPIYDGSTGFWNGESVPSLFGLQPMPVADATDANEWEMYLADASGGAFDITAPDPAYLPFNVPQFAVKNIGASGTVTIVPFDGETIEGGSSLALDTQYEMAWLISDGTNWWKVNPT